MGDSHRPTSSQSHKPIIPLPDYCNRTGIDRGRYLKVGVKLGDDERVSPLRSGGPGVSPPEMFGNFMCKMGHFGAKLHFVFKAKCNFHTNFWSLTNGSLKLLNGKVYSPLFMHCH